MTAAAVAVVLGAAGCGAGEGGGASAAPSASARPEDSGPLTKDRVRAELDTSAADAGAPPPDPDWRAMGTRAKPGSLGACGVSYRGYGTETEPVHLRRYEAVVDELRERGWQQSGERRERKTSDGTVGEVLWVFKKRGWSLVAEFRSFPDEGYINLAAGEDACVKQAGGGTGAGPLG
ncbi:hypothetical protein ABZX98_11845 [Streptomyces sp. NPDC002992]|uniref:hypothetical protein n=1 Tax=Streptomyces sp. NPDC002992 TaxID=3154273 RepID=UPI0033B48263